MNQSNISVIVVMVTSMFGSLAAGQTIGDLDGLYYPSTASPEDWSCSIDHLGMDLGALGIGNGYLDGIENRCELVNPQQSSDGTGLRFIAVCSGEGETYSDTVTITKTDTGVIIDRNRRSVAWTACSETPGATTTSVTAQNGWVFADGVASIQSEGSFLEFSCVPAGAASTIPVARMSGCPLCWQGDEIDFGFRVDGGATEVFTFTKQSNDMGMTSDLYGYLAWREGIFPQLMVGHRLDVYEGDAFVASYPLNGSSAALRALLAKCN